jgi:peptidoglycan biosynthesis protein MviN/MurJ (putative lipid II flippase)
LATVQTHLQSSGRTIAFASIIWASSIFLSRIIGLLREQIIGRTLGATRLADLYFASFTLPDFLNYLLAAGALSIVFIPIFVEYVECGEHDNAWRALSVIANFIIVVGGLAIMLLMIFARPLAGLVAPCQRIQFISTGESDIAGADFPRTRRTIVGCPALILPVRRESTR